MMSNGRAPQRGPSRTPPFVLVGLLLIMCFLGYSYWNYSSSNSVLVSQLELARKEKSDSDVESSQLKKDLELAKKKIASLEIQISQNSKTLEAEENRNNLLRVDLEQKKVDEERQKSMMEQCDEKLSVLQKDLEAANEEKGNFQRMLDAEREKAPVCTMESCHDSVQQILKIVSSLVGSKKIQQALEDADLTAESLMEGINFPDPQEQGPKQPSQDQVNQEQASQDQNNLQQEQSQQQPSHANDQQESPQQSEKEEPKPELKTTPTVPSDRSAKEPSAVEGEDVTKEAEVKMAIMKSTGSNTSAGQVLGDYLNPPKMESDQVHSDNSSKKEVQQPFGQNNSSTNDGSIPAPDDVEINFNALEQWEDKNDVEYEEDDFVTDNELPHEMPETDKDIDGGKSKNEKEAKAEALPDAGVEKAAELEFLSEDALGHNLEDGPGVEGKDDGRTSTEGEKIGGQVSDNEPVTFDVNEDQFEMPLQNDDESKKETAALGTEDKDSTEKLINDYDSGIDTDGFVQDTEERQGWWQNELKDNPFIEDMKGDEMKDVELFGGASNENEQ